MRILGIQGSPRKDGNSNYLLSYFLETAEKKLRAETEKIHIIDYNIKPCIGCYVCEKERSCNIDDDLKREIFPNIFNSDLVVISSPIYFANIPSHLKTLIDRAQEFWIKRYIFKDAIKKNRFGLFLSVSGSDNKKNFESAETTIKYFFDSIGYGFKGSLTFGNIEKKGEMKRDKIFQKEIKKILNFV